MAGSLSTEDVVPRLRGRLGRTYRFVESCPSTQRLLRDDDPVGAVGDLVTVEGERLRPRVVQLVGEEGRHRLAGVVEERRRHDRGHAQRVRDRREVVDAVAVRADQGRRRGDAGDPKRRRLRTEASGRRPHARAGRDRPEVRAACVGRRIPGPVDGHLRPGSAAEDRPARVGDGDGPRERGREARPEPHLARDPAPRRRRVELRQADRRDRTRDRGQAAVERAPGAGGQAGVAVAGARAEEHRPAGREALVAALAAFLLVSLPASAASRPKVLVVHFAADINPVTQDFVDHQIDRANKGGYSAVVVLLDTPGGLSTSMEKIYQRELASKVPVIVYVSPQGAGAASAGVFVAEAGDILAMAPETNIGSSTPIDQSGGNLGSDLRRKVINHFAAKLRALAGAHGRNVKWADAAVRKASNLTATEALQMNVIDVMAPNLTALLNKIDGRKTKPKGIVLHTATAELVILAVVVFLVLLFLISAIKVAREYERGIVFRLGRLFPQPKGPGLFLLIPIVDRMVKVDLRTITLNIPPQEVITKDNVPARVNAVAYFRIVEPKAAIVQIENFMVATSQIAQTTLRSVLGQHVLDELLSEREKINSILQGIIDEATAPWGIKVSIVEVKDVEIPGGMQRAMARQAEAERERRAKIINAEGGFQASEGLKDAANVIADHPMSLQLRFLQTMLEISSERSSTIILPLPIELFRPLMEAARGGGKSWTRPQGRPP